MDELVLEWRKTHITHVVYMLAGLGQNCLRYWDSNPARFAFTDWINRPRDWNDYELIQKNIIGNMCPQTNLLAFLDGMT